MNRLIIVSLLLCALISDAQTIRYYSLTKMVRGEMQQTDVSGGQFISFIDDICYESNKNGIGVGHGTLKKNDNLSNSSFKIYRGDSYWGDGATFKFKYDMSALNVILDNGDVYVYKEMPAPADVKTCSLIRRKKGKSGSASSTSSSTSSSSGYVQAQPNYNSTNTNNYIGSNVGTGAVQSQSVAPAKQPTRHECPLCHGKGRIVRDNPVATYGNDTQVWCGECGRYYMRSTGHAHVTCTQCHGRGYYTSE